MSDVFLGVSTMLADLYRLTYISSILTPDAVEKTCQEL